MSCLYDHPIDINHGLLSIITFQTYTSVLSIALYSALTLLVGRQEEHPSYKKLGIGLLMMTI